MTDSPDKGRTKPVDTEREEASAKLLSSLGEKVAQAQYNKVAPGFKPGGNASDPYYEAPPEGTPTKGKYRPDGTLYPGADQRPPASTTTSGGETVPNFQDRHKNKQLQPGEKYTPNPIGAEVSNQLNGGKAPADRQYSWQGGDFFDSRVQQTIAMRGQHTDLLNATIFGAAATVPIPYLHGRISQAADNAVAKAPEGSLSSKMGKWWQVNADPSKSGAADLMKTDPKHLASFEKFETLKSNLEKASKGTDEAAEIAREKFNFLKERSANFNQGNVAEASVIKGNSAFTQAELEILTNRAASGKIIEAAADKQAGRLATMVDNAPSWMKRMGGGVLGTVTTYGAIGLDRSMTKRVAGEEGVHQSWNLSQFAAPVAFAALPGKWKLAAPLAAVAASQAVDGLARTTGITAPDRWNAASGVFDGWNGAFVAGSLTLATYAKNPWAKAAIAAVGTIPPLLMHGVQDNITGNLKGRADNARESIQDDHSERTYSSLQAVDRSLSSVIDKKEDWVASNVDASFAAMNKQWANLSNEQKLLALRDDASTTGALSRSILEKGTRLSDKGSEPHYMLGGYEADIGGRGLHYMLRTRNSADKAAQLTQGIITENETTKKDSPTLIKGELPTAKEVTDLQKYSADAQADITKILDGKHDMRGAFDELVKKAEVLDKEFLKTYIKAPDRLILLYNEKGAKAQEMMNKAAGENNEPLRKEAQLKMEEYGKIVGKLYRDQAVAYMAMAAAKMKNGNDGGGAYDLLIDDGTNRKDIFESNGARKGYNGAQGTLRMAENYSPNNPDLQELGGIFSELAKQMAEKKKLQLTSTATNILGYRDNFATRPAQ